jgi:DNA repair photolyase
MNHPPERTPTGRGTPLNPPSRFQRHHTEHDPGEVLASSPKTEFYTDASKSIFSTFDSPDLPAGRSVNPYQGCEHGCIYCYARNAHTLEGFSAGLDFEHKILVKSTAPELLAKRFRQKGYRPAPIELSGNTDCYQPAERQFRLTRRLLQVFRQHGHPVGIVTKNSLILRDLDILKDLAAQQLVHVYITLTTLNESLRRVLEPRTPTAQRRLETVMQLTDAGIPVGVMTAPIIPGLTDHEIPKLVGEAARHGARTVGYTVVQLNGAVGTLFEEWVRRYVPDRAEKVLGQIRSCHGGEPGESRGGTRLYGEGPVAEHIRQVHQLARRKYLAGRTMPPFDLTRFQREPEQLGLF